MDHKEDSRTDESIIEKFPESSLWSPTVTESSNTTTSISYPEPSPQASPDYSKDKFYPNTLKYIEIEIKRKYENR